MRLFNQLHKRLDKLRIAVPGRRCECPREPVEPIDENDPDIKVLPPIDLPCGKCGGLVTITYVQRIIRTEQEKKPADS